MAPNALPTQAEIEEMVKRVKFFANARTNNMPAFRESMPVGDQGGGYHLVGVLWDAASMLEALGKTVAEKGEREPGWFLDGE